MGELALSGASVSGMFPSLGIGAAGIKAKIPMIKSMIADAKSLGMDGQELGASLTDKQAKAGALKKIESRVSVIESNEQAVNNDFDKVVLPAAKAVSDAQWQTASPLLNSWLQTGIMATTGDAKLNNFLGSLTTTLTKYSGVVAGNTGAGGTTAQMNTELQGVLNRGLSYNAIKDYINNVAKPEMNNTVNGFKSTSSSLKQMMSQADGTFLSPSTGTDSTNNTSSTGTSVGGSTGGDISWDTL